MTPTRKDFASASTHPSGHGFCSKQLKVLGVQAGRPWIHKFIGRPMPDALWIEFVRAGDEKREQNRVKLGMKAKEPESKPRMALYTDGSCSPNPGPGSWAVIVPQESGPPITLCGKATGRTTNNEMELTAIYRAILWLKANNSPAAVIHSDSRYAIDCVAKWAASWKRKGWKKAGGEIKNLSLIQAMHELYIGMDVAFEWVRGHNGNTWNEAADRLAAKGALD